MAGFIHPTAIVEPKVVIGENTKVWDNVHLRGPAQIGRDCIIGEKTYVAYDVIIADRVKINAFVYICAAVTIETGVMIAAGTTFTNDMYPRATTADLKHLRSSAPDEHTLPTLVREGATIGARATIGCDLTIGRFAMVGMGATVTKSVPDFHLVVGSPARPIALVCRCGQPFLKLHHGHLHSHDDLECPACGLRYAVDDGHVIELTPPGASASRAQSLVDA
jgi:acetyltransferase-like isoleucine patch superfamily enzyme